MQCTNPVDIAGFKLACGKCRGCRIARSRDWTARIIHEMVYIKEASFVTFTYDEDHLPSDGGLHKSEIQNCFKRLRKNYEGLHFKYYAAGEYGGVNGRPHYHVIFLGIGQNWEGFKWISKVGKKPGRWARVAEWKNGFVHVGTVTRDSVLYVTDYIQNKLNGELAVQTYGSKESPFQIVSQGFGKKYCLENQAQLKQTLSMTLGSVRLGLPRYYKEKLEIKKNVNLSRALEERAIIRDLERSLKIQERLGRKLTREEWKIFEEQNRSTIAENLKAKAETRRKRN